MCLSSKRLREMQCHREMGCNLCYARSDAVLGAVQLLGFQWGFKSDEKLRRKHPKAFCKPCIRNSILRLVHVHIKKPGARSAVVFSCRIERAAGQPLIVEGRGSIGFRVWDSGFGG